MISISTENLIKHLVKYRRLIVLLFLLVLVGVSGVSYYKTGRNYRAAVGFYLNANSIAFLPKEEIEVVKSIAASEQLYQFVVRSENLVKYYNETFSYDAEDDLKAATKVNVSDHGKVSINIEDKDNYFAFRIANEMMHKINLIYSDYMKTIFKAQSLNCEQQVHYYTVEKNSIMKQLARYPVMALDLEFADDSLTGPNYLKRLNKFGKQTNMKMEDIVTVLGLFYRLNKVEQQIYQYNDQNQKVQGALYLLNRNHIIITDKLIDFKRSVEVSSHFLYGLKISSIVIIILISLIIFLKLFNKELRMVVGWN